MDQLQINFAVGDLAAGVRFYSEMFASEPVELKPDYAKWMIDDPRMSLRIFTATDTSKPDAAWPRPTQAIVFDMAFIRASVN